MNNKENTSELSSTNLEQPENRPENRPENKSKNKSENNTDIEKLKKEGSVFRKSGSDVLQMASEGIDYSKVVKSSIEQRENTKKLYEYHGDKDMKLIHTNVARELQAEGLYGVNNIIKVDLDKEELTEKEINSGYGKMVLSILGNITAFVPKEQREGLYTNITWDTKHKHWKTLTGRKLSEEEVFAELERKADLISKSPTAKMGHLEGKGLKGIYDFVLMSIPTIGSYIIDTFTDNYTGKEIAKERMIEGLLGLAEMGLNAEEMFNDFFFNYVLSASDSSPNSLAKKGYNRFNDLTKFRKTQIDEILKDQKIRMEALFEEKEKEMRAGNWSTLASQNIKDGFTSVFGDWDEKFEMNRNLNSTITRLAAEKQGKKVRSITGVEEVIDPEDVIEIDGIKYPRTIPNSKGSTSIFDVKTIAMDKDGNPIMEGDTYTDGNKPNTIGPRRPLYIDKYTPAEKVLKSDWGALGSYYWWAETGGELVGQGVGAVATGYLTGGGVGLLGRGVSALGRATRITKGIDKVGKIFYKNGTKLAKAKSKFARGVQVKTTGLLTNTQESYQIAMQVEREVMNEFIDKHAGIDLDEITAEVYKSHKGNISDAMLMFEAEAIANTRRHNWMKTADPELIKDLKIRSQLSADMVIGTNFLGMVFDMHIANYFVRTKSLSTSRNVLKNPKKFSGRKLAKVGFVEGLQEGGGQEAGTNMVGEIGGKWATEKKWYSLKDFVNNDFMSSEYWENFMGGFLSAGPQGAITSQIDHSSKYRQYQKQQQLIEQLKGIKGLDFKNLSKELATIGVKANMIKSIEATIKEMEANKFAPEVIDQYIDSVVEQMIIVSAMSGTSGVFEASLTELLKEVEAGRKSLDADTKLTAEEKKQRQAELDITEKEIKFLISRNAEVSTIYDEYLGYEGLGDIITNRLEKQRADRLVERAIEENDLYQQSEDKQVEDAIAELKKQGRKRVNKTQVRKKVREVMDRNQEKFDYAIDKSKNIQRALEEQFEYLLSFEGQEERRNKKTERKKAHILRTVNSGNIFQIRERIKNDKRLKDDAEFLAKVNQKALDIEVVPFKYITHDLFKNKVGKFKNALSRGTELTDREKEKNAKKPKTPKTPKKQEVQETQVTPDEQLSLGVENETTQVAPVTTEGTGNIEVPVQNTQETTDGTTTTEENQTSSKQETADENSVNDENETPQEEEDDGDGFGYPNFLDQNNTEHQKLVDEFVELIRKNFHKYDLNTMSFKEFIGLMMAFSNPKDVENNLYFLREAWKKVTGKEVSQEIVNDVYNHYFALEQFGDRYQELLDRLANKTRETEAIDRQTEAIKDQTEAIRDQTRAIDENTRALQESRKTTSHPYPKDEKGLKPIQEPPKEEKIYDPSKGEYVSLDKAEHTQTHCSTTELKLGDVSSVSFEEEEKNRVNTTNEIKEYALPFLDWRNFNPSKEVELAFDIDYMLILTNKIIVWDNLDAQNLTKNDAKPTPRSISVREFLIETFEGELTNAEIINALIEYKNTQNADNVLFKNERFLRYAPVGIVNDGSLNSKKAVLKGGLNSTDWFNNANMTLYVKKVYDKDNKLIRVVNDTKRREEAIKENQELNIQARKDILAGGNSLKLPIKVNKYYNLNTTILKEGQTHTPFNSVLSQFNNDVEEFSKFGAIVYFSNNTTIVQNEKEKTFTINGKKVTKEQVVNYDKVIAEKQEAEEKRLKELNNNDKAEKNVNLRGYSMILFQVGVDETGVPKYMLYENINNHPSKAKSDFKRTAGILQKLYFTFIADGNKDISPLLERQSIDRIKKLFGEHLDNVDYISFLQSVFPSIKSGEREKDYKDRSANQGFDISIFGSNNPRYNKDTKIPDLSQFVSLEHFIEELTDGKEIPMTTPMEVYLRNVHTNLHFTKIEDKKGEAIYTPMSQPFILFEYENRNPKPKEPTIPVTPPVTAQVENKKTPLEEAENNLKNIEQQEKELEQKEKDYKEDAEKNLNNELEGDYFKSLTEEEQIKEKARLEKEKEKEEKAFKERMLQEAERLKAERQQYEEVKKKELAEKKALELAEKLKKEEEEFQKMLNEVEVYKSYLANLLLSRAVMKLNFSEAINVATIYKLVQQEFNNLLKDKTITDKQKEFLKAYKNEILGISKYDGSIKEVLNDLLGTDKATNLTEETEVEQSENSELNEKSEHEKSMGKASYEEDIVKSMSSKMKLLFFGLKNTKSENTFYGLHSFKQFSDMVDAVRQVMSELKNNNFETLIDAMKERVNRNPEEFGFYNELIERLELIEKTNPEMIKELLYVFNQPKLSMKFVIWNKIGDRIMGDVFDANSRSPQILKRKQWVEGLKTSEVITMQNDDYFVVNESKLQQLGDIIDKFNSLTNKGKVGTSEDVVKFFQILGIKVNKKTIDNFIEKYYKDNTHDNSYPYNLINTDGNTSIIHIIYENLMNAVVAQKEGKQVRFENVFNQNTDKEITINPLLTNNTQINDFINDDNHHEFIPASTMYVGGKNVYQYQKYNSITNKIKDLKSAIYEYIENKRKNPDAKKDEVLTGLIEDFRKSPITSNSFLLDMIETHPEEVVGHLDIFMNSLEFIKQQGTASQTNRGVLDLSERDKLVAYLQMFSEREGKFRGAIKNGNYNGVQIYKGYLNFPTLSDSEQVPFLKTIMLDFASKIKKTDLETGELNPAIIDIVREQLLVSDLLRIADFIKAGVSSNISGYDKGAVWITGMQSLNMVEISYRTKGEVLTKRPLITLFRNFIQKNGSGKDIRTLVDAFVKKYQKEIDKAINENIHKEVDKYISKDGKSGLFIDHNLIDNKGHLILGDGKKSKEKDNRNNYFSDHSARVVAFDYVLNQLIGQKEIQTLFAGDVALYFKDKMTTNELTGLPEVTFQDVINYYDRQGTNTINDITQGKELSELTEEQIKQLKDGYPLFKYLNDFVGKDPIHQETAFVELLPVVKMKVANMFKEVQNNLAKRLKELISTGLQFPDTKNQPNYIQIMVNDVEIASENLLDIIDTHYPEKVNKLTPIVNEFLELQRKDNKTSKEVAREKELKNQIKKEVPNIAGYLDITSTDAQEYTSWREGLNQLLQQGRLTQEQYNHLSKKLEQQSKDLEEGNAIKSENLLTKEEKELAMMQPSKPLYSGMVTENVNGHRVQRYVYIKSSSFVLLPEMTQMFPNQNNLRKNIEKIEKQTGQFVRVSYQSANKVGGVSNSITTKELYDTNTSTDRMLESSVSLSRGNFYIQQDKPFKSDKNAEKGIVDKISMATQFEKIILGDGVNKMGHIFNAEHFDTQLLSDLNIEVKDGKVNGRALEKIYNEIYKRHQQLLNQNLFNKLGIKEASELREGKPQAMERLSDILKKQLTNKQSKKSLDLVYYAKNKDGKYGYYSKEEIKKQKLTPIRADFKIPLHLSANSREIETALLSLVNKNNVKLRMPGFSSVVASQQGFDVQMYDSDNKNSIEELKKKGLILTKNFDPSKGLQATRDAKTGKLKSAQVFIANKFKVYNKETGKHEYVDLTQYVDENNVIDTSKLPQEVLEMFSFRIPTSSHQSGTMIEIAGFLPHNVGDLMIVPKEHTVQIGEDYDIDVRYVYQYNYIKDENGNLKKLSYADIDVILNEKKEAISSNKNSLKDIKARYDKARENVFKQVFKDHKGRVKEVKYIKSDEALLEEIATLKEALDNYYSDNVIHAIFKNDYDVEVVDKNFLKEKIAELEAKYFQENGILTKEEQQEYEEVISSLRAELKNTSSELAKTKKDYAKSIRNNGLEERILENNIVSLYKSVFMSADKEMQQLITKVLSTDFAENSASVIGNKISEIDDDFNLYSPHTQSATMKLGADGNKGIGVHSNIVTLNSIFQQLEDGYNLMIGFEIRLGNNIFDDVLGKLHDKDNKRISEYIGESQNSALDNQKLQIMGRRNENMETINVFALLQMAGLENDGVRVNGQVLSYASLFIAQPILQKYVSIVGKYKSSTNTTFGNSIRLAKEELENYLIKNLDKRFKTKDDRGKEILIPLKDLDSDLVKEIGSKLTSEYLYNQLTTLEDSDIISQYYIYQVFSTLQAHSNELRKLQRLINIEQNGLGISYVETLDLRQRFFSLYEYNESTNDFAPIHPSTRELFGELSNTQLTEDFIDIGDGYYFKPSKHFGHKIANTMSMGYNLWNHLFPYQTKFYERSLNVILESLGIDPNNTTLRTIKEKIEIIDAVKDFVMSDTSHIATSDYVNSLFFNDPTIKQESLGAYLMRLKNNPEYAHMFNNPFFRDLNIDIRGIGFPTIINYNNSKNHPLYTTELYNYLNTLVHSEKELPSKQNGEKVTEATLMRDLLLYSLKANQENGSTGFRSVLPMSLFEKYGMTTKNNVEISESVYGFAVTQLEEYLGSTINENFIIDNKKNIGKEDIKLLVAELNKQLKEEKSDIVYDIFEYNEDTNQVILTHKNRNKVFSEDIFIEQYIQHNSDKVKSISVANKLFGNILTTIGLKPADFTQGKVQEFTMHLSLWQIKQKKLPHSPYIGIRLLNGEIQLYKLTERKEDEKGVSFKYERIQTLGTNGFNEYDVNGKNKKTSIAETVSQVSNQEAEKRVVSGVSLKANERIKSLVKMFNETDVVTMFNNMVRDERDGVDIFLRILKQFINDEDLKHVQIKITDDPIYNVVNAWYRPSVKTLLITQHFLDTNPDSKRIREVIKEELLHFATKTSMEAYVGKNFRTIKDNTLTPEAKSGKEIPASVQRIYDVYNQAINYYNKKYGNEFVRSLIKSKGREEENIKLKEIGYRMNNIHEFIAGVLDINSEFSKEMNSIAYQGETIINKLRNAVAELLSRILKSLNKGSIASEVHNSLLVFFAEHTNTKVEDMSFLNNVTIKEMEQKAEEKIRIAEEKLRKLEEEAKITDVTINLPITLDELFKRRRKYFAVYKEDFTDSRDIFDSMRSLKKGDVVTIKDVSGKEMNVILKYQHYSDYNEYNTSVFKAGFLRGENVTELKRGGEKIIFAIEDAVSINPVLTLKELGKRSNNPKLNC